RYTEAYGRIGVEPRCCELSASSCCELSASISPGRQGRESDQGLGETVQLTRRSIIRSHCRLVDGAVIVVVSLRQIGRMDHHFVGIEGNGGRGFADGRLDSP